MRFDEKWGSLDGYSIEEERFFEEEEEAERAHKMFLEKQAADDATKRLSLQAVLDADAKGEKLVIPNVDHKGLQAGMACPTLETPAKAQNKSQSHSQASHHQRSVQGLARGAANAG